jgi:hypothetical protein
LKAETLTKPDDPVSIQTSKSREERKAELEQLSSSDQGRMQLVELLNRYRGQNLGETLPSGTLPVTEILEHEFGTDSAIRAGEFAD